MEESEAGIHSEIMNTQIRTMVRWNEENMAAGVLVEYLSQDYSLRWVYIYSPEIGGIICIDVITGAWYRVAPFPGDWKR